MYNRQTDSERQRERERERERQTGEHVLNKHI